MALGQGPGAIGCPHPGARSPHNGSGGAGTWYWGPQNSSLQARGRSLGLASSPAAPSPPGWPMAQSRGHPCPRHRSGGCHTLPRGGVPPCLEGVTVHAVSPPGLGTAPKSPPSTGDTGDVAPCPPRGAATRLCPGVPSPWGGGTGCRASLVPSLSLNLSPPFFFFGGGGHPIPANVPSWATKFGEAATLGVPPHHVPPAGTGDNGDREGHGATSTGRDGPRGGWGGGAAIDAPGEFAPVGSGPGAQHVWTLLVPCPVCTRLPVPVLVRASVPASVCPSVLLSPHPAGHVLRGGGRGVCPWGSRWPRPGVCPSVGVCL